MKKKLILVCIIMAIFGLLVAAPLGPALADNSSNLEITNLSDTSYSFTHVQLLDMPKTVVNADLYCYGSLVNYGNWGGVLLSYLLTRAQETPEVFSIQFVATDGYRVALPIDLALQPQIIIAYEKDSKPLAEGLRLIVPGANGAVWIAGITSVTMSASTTDYPAPVNLDAGTIADQIPTPNGKAQESISQQQTPVKPQPTKPQNSSSIQVTTPTNITSLYQPTAKPQLLSESLNLGAAILCSTAFALAISLIAAASLAYRHKRRHISTNT